ncbi:PREDICTED: uncharacterized protein C23G7.06c-like [Camelina sativa]|uniref:Uncharacterized protein C23G7.06c-like n=1 Tax=Camelina sativa TaxID=90675 RepID=A0ABM0Y8F3_CAMSA|nr:PREDICTED: uncharacterized protein C23G7.06c-like [Camelina sativa]
MKPPPSDQLWFGFTNMPDIEFNLASAVGEHKITNSHVAMFLVNRFKTAIREVMVLPNCESLTIPWMTAEKDDWIERNIAPFMWLNQDSTSDHEAAEAKSKADKPPTPEQMQKTANVVPQKPRIEEVPVSAPSADSTALTIESQKSLDELQTPLLESSEKQDTVARGGNGNAGDILPRSIQSPSMSSTVSSEEDDSNSKGKKMGAAKARMFDFRKKVGEKFEEKKRHVEERSRQIVEKMRGP